MCTENLQLTGAKVSTPEFREYESKLSRHFKGLISIGNVGVRSLDGSAAFGNRSLGVTEKPANSGLLRTRERSPDSRFPVFGGQTTESLLPVLRIFPFYGDYRWRLGSSATAARGRQSISRTKTGPSGTRRILTGRDQRALAGMRIGGPSALMFGL